MLARFLVGLSLAALAVTPLCAAPQDMTPISDRILSDPAFLPVTGQFYGETSYGYEHDSLNLYNNTGAQFGNSSHHLSNVRQYFSFGITDALSVNFSEAYGFSGTTRLNTPLGATTNSQSGFQNPTVGLTYRAIDQRNHPVSLDLFARYSPDAFTAKSATGSSDASIARGGPSADFGVALARETRGFTIRGSVTATYLGRSNLFNPLDGFSTAQSSYWAPSLGIQTQTRLTDRLSVNVDGTYTFNGNPIASNSYNGISHTENLGNIQTIGAGLNYHFVPNRFVGSLTYSHSFFDHTSYTFPSDAALDTSRSRSQDTFGVMLRYVFK